MARLSHSEVHMAHRIGWLRAAVLGANDGILSTSTLVVGVASAGSASRGDTHRRSGGPRGARDVDGGG